ncbi:hypothetical protein [Mesorhizobium silamurunense]|uniref:hypothetical protein n=1 Tax=Mesorhizobium silamurunense TaxID=499528 RepID=UPI001784293D|nr:hypothetical protein [Mesorhizobium silamurunense]
MLASAVRRYRQRNMVGMAASLLMAALCAYALMLSPARSEPAQTPIARCEFFLLLMMSPKDRGLTYRRLSATERSDPPKVTIEFETRNKAHAPGRTTGSCEFDRDRRHITFFTLHGLRSQIVQ